MGCVPNMARRKLSIVAPAYNEEKKVKNTFLRLTSFFSNKGYELEYVFVEDGSKDRTRAVLDEIAKGRSDVRVLLNERNMGKGYSIKKGMLAASGDHILFIDVDMSTPLSAFSDFEEYLDDYDIVIGSRWLEESNIRIPQPRLRRMFAIIFYIIVKTFFLKGIIDTNCGFKCYKRAVAREIFSKQRLNSWGFDVENLYIAQKRGYRIKEVPVIWAHGRDSKVDLLRVPLATLIELIEIKINDWKGRYE